MVEQLSLVEVDEIAAEIKPKNRKTYGKRTPPTSVDGAYPYAAF